MVRAISRAGRVKVPREGAVETDMTSWTQSLPVGFVLVDDGDLVRLASLMNVFSPIAVQCMPRARLAPALR
jgi:hypothetical protein